VRVNVNVLSRCTKHLFVRYRFIVRFYCANYVLGNKMCSVPKSNIEWN